MPEPVRWMPVVIHPQTGGICDALSMVGIWPDDGFLAPDPFGRVEAALWPVPSLRGARLVDCRCGKTGIQPHTVDDMVRYIPGAVREGNHIVLQPNPLVKYPDGAGADEADGPG